MKFLHFSIISLLALWVTFFIPINAFAYSCSVLIDSSESTIIGTRLNLYRYDGLVLSVFLFFQIIILARHIKTKWIATTLTLCLFFIIYYAAFAYTTFWPFLLIIPVAILFLGKKAAIQSATLMLLTTGVFVVFPIFFQFPYKNYIHERPSDYWSLSSNGKFYLYDAKNISLIQFDPYNYSKLWELNLNKQLVKNYRDNNCGYAGFSIVTIRDSHSIIFNSHILIDVVAGTILHEASENSELHMKENILMEHRRCATYSFNQAANCSEIARIDITSGNEIWWRYSDVNFNSLKEDGLIFINDQYFMSLSWHTASLISIESGAHLWNKILDNNHIWESFASPNYDPQIPLIGKTLLLKEKPWNAGGFKKMVAVDLYTGDRLWDYDLPSEPLWGQVIKYKFDYQDSKISFNDGAKRVVVALKSGEDHAAIENGN